MADAKPVALVACMPDYATEEGIPWLKALWDHLLEITLAANDWTLSSLSERESLDMSPRLGSSCPGGVRLWTCTA